MVQKSLKIALVFKIISFQPGSKILTILKRIPVIGSQYNSKQPLDLTYS